MHLKLLLPAKLLPVALMTTILFSATTAVSLANHGQCPMGFKGHGAEAKGDSAASPQAGHHHMKARWEHHMHELEEKIGMTAEQKQQAEQIKADYRAQIDPLTKNVWEKRKAMMEFALTPGSSEADTLARQDELTQLQAQVDKLRMESLFKMKALLTPEQQQKAFDLAKEKMDAHKKHHEGSKQGCKSPCKRKKSADAVPKE